MEDLRPTVEIGHLLKREVGTFPPEDIASLEEDPLLAGQHEAETQQGRKLQFLDDKIPKKYQNDCPKKLLSNNLRGDY